MEEIERLRNIGVDVIGEIERLKSLGVDFSAIVVESQPFGRLIDANTRQAFTPPLGEFAYPICRLLAYAYKAAMAEERS